MIVVFGGYGVFGSLVARGLHEGGLRVAIAGRDESRAKAWASALGGTGGIVRGLRADVGNLDSCKAALQGAMVAVNCSGPFRATNAQLIDACLELGVHYVDIADDRAWARRVYDFDDRFREKGLTLAWGCSSFPGISGALASALAEGATVPPVRVRCSLFIGNRNPKGFAAIRSAVGMIGAPIEAPQGTIKGWSNFERVELPAPFGARRLLNAQAPDYDVMARLLGAKHVTVKAGFELRISNLLFRCMAACGPIWGATTARILWLAGMPLGWLGRSGGAIVVELFYASHTRRGYASGGTGAQKLAAWPAVLAARALCAGEVKRGCVTAFEALGARELLVGLQEAGFEVRL
ncbi:MAG: saccharopine dehydrogenase NADP-binding domain-containing protein [Planctomycetes bacterium]|nr:saccharopine dehydrogenase NADP-binding domain-containing protein [Planctomycetota bacterium]